MGSGRGECQGHVRLVGCRLAGVFVGETEMRQEEAMELGVGIELEQGPERGQVTVPGMEGVMEEGLEMGTGLVMELEGQDREGELTEVVEGCMELEEGDMEIEKGISH